MTFSSQNSVTIEQNLIQVQRQIEAAVSKYQRTPGSVTLLAVSKTKPLEMIEAALSCQQYHFGENYLQEALSKIEALSELEALGKLEALSELKAFSQIEASQSDQVCWHFIGAIQSNKTKPIAEHFDWVHTVASLKIARRLSEQRPDHKPDLNVLLQVNIDNERSKSGIAPAELAPLVSSLTSLRRIRLRGLMTIPEAGKHFDNQRQSFSRLRILRDELKQQFDLPDFDQLSMGMSGDLDAAIAEGATIVRIGTAIFGSRAGSRTGSRAGSRTNSRAGSKDHQARH